MKKGIDDLIEGIQNSIYDFTQNYKETYSVDKIYVNNEDEAIVRILPEDGGNPKLLKGKIEYESTYPGYLNEISEVILVSEEFLLTHTF